MSALPRHDPLDGNHLFREALLMCGDLSKARELLRQWLVESHNAHARAMDLALEAMANRQ